MSTYKGARWAPSAISAASASMKPKHTAGGEGGRRDQRSHAGGTRGDYSRKGTNRSQFFRGRWINTGGHWLQLLMSDLQAAYLWAQLEAAERINQQRLALWQNYYDALPLARRAYRTADGSGRLRAKRAHVLHCCVISRIGRPIAWLKEAEILAVFHYIPCTAAGRRTVRRIPR